MNDRCIKCTSFITDTDDCCGIHYIYKPGNPSKRICIATTFLAALYLKPFKLIDPDGRYIIPDELDTQELELAVKLL